MNISIEYLFLLIPIIILVLISCSAIIYFLITYKKSLDRFNAINTPTQSVEYTNLSLSMIDDIIKQEISYKLRNNIYLNEKYDIKQLDVDLKEIIESVYVSFNSSFYTNPTLVINSAAVMNYIIKKTSIVFLDTVMTYNNSLRSV